MHCALASLTSGLHRLLAGAGHPAARIMARWPDPAATVREPVPRDLPVTAWLSWAVETAPAATVGLARALRAAAPRLRWEQTYGAGDLGADFLAGYGWTLIAGPEGPVACDGLLAGFLLLGPGVEYPVHGHSAEEVYVVVSGEASWTLGGAGWHPLPAGAVVHNPPWRPHGMRTDRGEPLLLAFLWNAAAVEKSRFRDDAPPPEAERSRR